MAKKKTFTPAVRCAVWEKNGKKCWFCRKPIQFQETEIDHVLPEAMLAKPAELQQFLKRWRLPPDFNINGFENWLPIHSRCNREKGKFEFEMDHSLKVKLMRLWNRAEKTAKLAERIEGNPSHARVFSVLFNAIAKKKITLHEVREMMAKFVANPTIGGLPKGAVLLSRGNWLAPSEIARECDCQCERNHCVGQDRKVYCFFDTSLDEWVTRTGLFFMCYDERVKCWRCSKTHKRGHIGKENRCGKPYRDQVNQCD